MKLVTGQGLKVLDEYAFEVMILKRDDLAQWFLDLCVFDDPRLEIDHQLLKDFKEHQLVEFTPRGITLGLEGRAIARDLGLLPTGMKSTSLTQKAERGRSVRELWARYQKTKGTYLRDRLVHTYLFLIRRHADSMHRDLPAEVSIDELYSAGIIGLVESIDAYDLSKEGDFAEFSAPFIRAAIVEQIRSMSWLPHLVRNYRLRIRKAHIELERELGRAPSNIEVCKQLGVSIDDYGQMLRAAEAVPYWRRPLPRVEARKRVIEKSDETRAELRKRLKNIITRELSRVERLVVILYYFEEMNFDEIGATLDHHPEAIREMHKSILNRVRTLLADINDVLAVIAA